MASCGIWYGAQASDQMHHMGFGGYEYGHGFGGYPTKDKFKDFDGVNDAYEYGRGFGGYPTKDKFKDFDDVNDAYEYPNLVYNTEVSQPDDAACLPGSAYCPLKSKDDKRRPSKPNRGRPHWPDGRRGRRYPPHWVGTATKYDGAFVPHTYN